MHFAVERWRRSSLSCLICLILHFLSADAKGNVVTIRSSTQMLGAQNILTFNFTFPQNITSGTVLSIVGLNGTQTESGPILVTNTDRAICANPTCVGDWVLIGGSISVTITSFIRAQQNFLISFVVRNSRRPNPPVSPWIYLNGFRFPASPIVLGSVPQSFPQTIVAQSTNLVLSRNILTISLLPNFPLPTGSTVTIGGIVQVRSPTSGPQTIQGRSAALFMRSPMWGQSNGTLLLVVNQTWNAGEWRTISFTVMNRATPQQVGVQPWIQAQADYEDYTYDFSVQLLNGTILDTIRADTSPIAYDFFIDPTMDMNYICEEGGIYLPAGAFPSGVDPMITMTKLFISNTSSDPCPLSDPNIEQSVCKQRIGGSVYYFEPSGITFSADVTIYLAFEGQSPSATTNSQLVLSKLTDAKRAAWQSMPPGSCPLLLAAASNVPILATCPAPVTGAPPVVDDLADGGYFLGSTSSSDFGYLLVQNGFISGQTSSFSTYGVIVTQQTFDRDSGFHRPAGVSYDKKVYFLGVGVSILGILAIVFFLDKFSQISHYYQGLRTLASKRKTIDVEDDQADQKRFLTGLHCSKSAAPAYVDELARIFERADGETGAVHAASVTDGKQNSALAGLPRQRKFGFFDSGGGRKAGPAELAPLLPRAGAGFNLEDHTNVSRFIPPPRRLVAVPDTAPGQGDGGGVGMASRELIAGREISRRIEAEYRLAMEGIEMRTRPETVTINTDRRVQY